MTCPVRFSRTGRPRARRTLANSCPASCPRGELLDMGVHASSAHLAARSSRCRGSPRRCNAIRPTSPCVRLQACQESTRCASMRGGRPSLGSAAAQRRVVAPVQVIFALVRVPHRPQRAVSAMVAESGYNFCPPAPTLAARFTGRANPPSTHVDDRVPLGGKRTNQNDRKPVI